MTHQVADLFHPANISGLNTSSCLGEGAVNPCTMDTSTACLADHCPKPTKNFSPVSAEGRVSKKSAHPCGSVHFRLRIDARGRRPVSSGQHFRVEYEVLPWRGAVNPCTMGANTACIADHHPKPTKNFSSVSAEGRVSKKISPPLRSIYFRLRIETPGRRTLADYQTCLTSA